MRNLHTIANCGALFHATTGSFLGSSFVFRYPNRLLTAAHYVGKAKPAELCVLIYATGRRIYPVKGINVHPKADVAVLAIEGLTRPPSAGRSIVCLMIVGLESK